MITEDINGNLLLIVDHVGLIQTNSKFDNKTIDKLKNICNEIRHNVQT